MEIKSKIGKVGNGYVFWIPKALVDCKILESGKEYILNPEEIEMDAVYGIHTCNMAMIGV